MHCLNEFTDECFYLFAVITVLLVHLQFCITFKKLLYYIGWTIVMCLWRLLFCQT